MSLSRKENADLNSIGGNLYLMEFSHGRIPVYEIGGCELM